MSNYHVLETNERDCESKVAFHIFVPDENNGVGVNLRTALSQYVGQQDNVSQVPWLESTNPTEFSAIQDGEIYEHIVSVKYSANLSVAEKRDIMDAKYTSLASSVPDKIRSLLRFWGFDRDVS